MERLEYARNYVPARHLSWQLRHTVLLVLVTGVVGWYGIYLAAIWLFELISL